MSVIGFIGTGHIAAPMARFLSGKGHRINVSDRNANVAQSLANSIGARVLDNQAVLDASDIVFLCLRPHVAQAVLRDLTFRADHRIVSVMAGVPLAALTTLCAPASDFTLTIPIGFLEQGGCPLPACPKPDLLASLFAPENPVIGVATETGLNAHFAICTMVPGMLDLMATGASWLGDQTGDQNGAAAYTTQLIAGFLVAVQGRDDKVLARERDALATDGTISLQMVEALRDDGVHDVLCDALQAISARLGD